MTESDKTGDKLAESIRRTKAGTASRTTTTRKAAPRRTSDPGPGTAGASRAAQESPSSTDPYTHGRRVWPD